MKTVQLGVFVLCGALAPGVALADDPAPAQWKAMDTNGDGELSPDEHHAAAQRMFETMDTNKDGEVTAAEMEAAQAKVTGKKAMKPAMMSPAEKIKTVDTNGDGMISAEEHRAGAQAMFEKMDTNQDGMLSQAELTAGHEKMMRKAYKEPKETKEMK